MLPLDLVQVPPRSPRKKLNAYCMLPRMIDIARAHLPGGRVGGYQIGRGMSASILAELGITRTEFIGLIEDSLDDDDVARRLSIDGTDTALLQLTARLERLTVADVPPEMRREFEQFYGTNIPADRTVFEVLIADDQALRNRSDNGK